MKLTVSVRERLRQGDEDTWRQAVEGLKNLKDLDTWTPLYWFLSS